MNTSHYPSLELCKKLTEIGFPNTMFYYEWVENFSGKIEYNIMPWHKMYDDEFVCPSVMEMLDVIPDEVDDLVFAMELWEWGYRNCNGYLEVGFEKSTPNALAEMILWLYENKHLTFKNGN